VETPISTEASTTKPSQTSIARSGSIGITPRPLAAEARPISKGQHDEAIQDLDHAITLKPDYAEAYCARGTVYFRKGQYDRAVEDFNRAIKLNPGFAEAFNGRGVTYGLKRQYDKAIQEFDHAIKLKPEFAEAYYARGTV
jgi:tetratricopeptide (TPR) repeat protein